MAGPSVALERKGPYPGPAWKLACSRLPPIERERTRGLRMCSASPNAEPYPGPAWKLDCSRLPSSERGRTSGLSGMVVDAEDLAPRDARALCRYRPPA